MVYDDTDHVISEVTSREAMRDLLGIFGHDHDYGDPRVNYPFYRTQFLVIVIQSLVGMILNVLVLSLFLSLSKIQQNKLHILNVSVVVVDLCYMTELFIEYCVNYSRGQYLGADNSAICIYNCFINLTMTIWSLTLIGSISYIIKSSSELESIDTNKRNLKMAIASGLYAIIGSAVLLAVAEGAQQVISGSYCIYNPTIPSTIIFSLFSSLPIIWISYNVFQISLSIRTGQLVLDAEGIQGTANYPYIKKLKNIGYFTAAMSICEIPVLIFFLYSRVAHVSKAAMFASGYVTMLYPSFFNPILFILTNRNINDQLIHMIDILLYRRNRAVQVVALTDNIEYFNVLESWLNNEHLLAIFRDYCKSIHAAENIMFYEDVTRYHQLGQAFLKRFDSTETIADLALLESWNELSALAKRMYNLYIKVSIRYIATIISPIILRPSRHMTVNYRRTSL